jgi:hypothetical protein
MNWLMLIVALLWIEGVLAAAELNALQVSDGSSRSCRAGLSSDMRSTDGVNGQRACADSGVKKGSADTGAKGAAETKRNKVDSRKPAKKTGVKGRTDSGAVKNNAKATKAAEGTVISGSSPNTTTTLVAIAALKKKIEDQGFGDGRYGRPPKSVTDLKNLYGTDAASTATPLDKVTSIYEAAFERGKSALPWWHLNPKLQWIPILILILMAFARDFFRKKFISLFDKIWEYSYRRLAGTRLFRSIALRRYLRSIKEKNRYIRLPFRQERPLEVDKVFIRLNVASSSSSTPTTLEAVIQQKKTCVVTGPPGSGKSMLLRKLALDHNCAEQTGNQQIPVLVDLNRFNEGGGDLKSRLVASFEHYDFPNAGRFVDAGLEGGFLFLLLDGLDEVSSEKSSDAPSARQLLVAQIRELITKYDSCKFVITCRTGVYHGELDNCTDARLAVAEFSADQIESYISGWAPQMPPHKSPAHLLQSLAERPRVLALAGNPLMLTVIAFLYSDTEFVLPHSRGEFYERAVGLLLERWKDDRNRFAKGIKIRVLQHLALWNQDSAHTTGSADRRTMALDDMLHEIKPILRTLMHAEEDAHPLLNEINDRSGLLIAVDGGQRYQFSHLTLQEYLAADKLKTKPQELLTRYAEAPDDWRECVKLWCGLDHDSTQLIEALRTTDTLLAFECISEAVQLDPSTWEQLFEEFKPRLAQSSEEQEAIIRTFGIVAADPRRRGRKALDYLKSVLDRGPDHDRTAYGAACRALAFTNLSDAARWLIDVAQRDDVCVRECVISMGDVAVQPLGSLILSKTSSLLSSPDWPIRALHRIGTVSAARLLVKILCESNDEKLRVAAAWALASLVRKPAIEAALETMSVPSNWKHETYLWVWHPFSPASNTSRVMAMVMHELVYDTLGNAVPEAVPDVRLAIPHCLIMAKDVLFDPNLPPGFQSNLMRAPDDRERAALEEKYMALVLLERQPLRPLPPSAVRMLESIPHKTRFALLTCSQRCEPEQWRNLRVASTEGDRGKWQVFVARAIYSAAVMGGAIAFGQLFAVNAVGMVAVLLAVFMLSWPSASVMVKRAESMFVAVVALGLGAAYGISTALVFRDLETWRNGLIAAIAIVCLGWGILWRHAYRWAGPQALRSRMWWGGVVAIFATAFLGVAARKGVDLFNASTVHPFLTFPAAVLMLGIPILGIVGLVPARAFKVPDFESFALALGVGCAYVCGFYGAAVAVDSAYMYMNIAYIVLVILILFHCLGSTFYRTMGASNPFHVLLKGDQDLDYLAPIRQVLLRSSIHRAV